MMLWILDEHGEPRPCRDVTEWAHWFTHADRVVASDRVDRQDGGGAHVSTVFTGIDSMPRGLLWESLVQGGPLDGQTCRYASKADALAGHRELMRRAAFGPPLPP